MGILEDLLADYNRAVKAEQRMRLEELRNLFNGWEADGRPVANGQPLTRPQTQSTYKTHPPKWSNLAEMNAYIKAHPPAAKPRTRSPETRRAEIEHELDIIRGRIPTPKGYSIDPGRIKELVQELKQLPTT